MRLILLSLLVILASCSKSDASSQSISLSAQQANCRAYGVDSSGLFREVYFVQAMVGSNGAIDAQGNQLESDGTTYYLLCINSGTKTVYRTTFKDMYSQGWMITMIEYGGVFSR